MSGADTLARFATARPVWRSVAAPSRVSRPVRGEPAATGRSGAARAGTSRVVGPRGLGRRRPVAPVRWAARRSSLAALLALVVVSCTDADAPSAGEPESGPGGEPGGEPGARTAAARSDDTVRDALATAGGAVDANALATAERLARFPAARVAEAGEVPPQAQRPGDAARGRQALVEEGYVACGLPLRVFRELAADLAPVGVPGREAAAEGLPYFVNASRDARGTEIASSNCLLCHGTALFGELVIGLGNEFADFTVDPSIAVERAGALVRGPDETAAWERYADRVHAIAPYTTMETVGANPANNLTFALIAHRDPETNAWLEKPALPLPSRTPPPVSVPPWWRMAKKHAMFNLGEGRGDHARLMMSASMLCSDSVAELEAIDRYAPDIRAYIAALEPPRWPFDLDEALAARGRELFEASCSVCHGTYAVDADGERRREGDRYPNRLVPLETIGTDPTLVEQAHGDAGLAWIDWFNRSYYGELALAAPGPGYVAPPLDGIWATGPFLHNGSVPNVRAVLDSTVRPARWHHVAADASDPESYDAENLGWHHLADERVAADRPAERIYDTARAGHGNGGHRFGDALSDAERDAVIEYLKTL